jgi:LPXTG-motif cell wall-anchored protein
MLAGFLIPIPILIRSSDPDPDPDPGEEMVTICHEGTNTITVGTSAQDAHLAHGDIVGTCEESGVIVKSIPKNTPLPNTGGPAILAVTAGLLLLSTAALGLLCVRRR